MYLLPLFEVKEDKIDISSYVMINSNKHLGEKRAKIRKDTLESRQNMFVRIKNKQYLDKQLSTLQLDTLQQTIKEDTKP